jgi:hypothetical protein
LKLFTLYETEASKLGTKKESKMINYLSGRKARKINGKREDSKVGLATLFYTGDRTK